MSSAGGAVLAASASAVAKAFVIAAVGFCATKFPKGIPYMPSHQIGMISRFSYALLSIPLIYTVIGSTLSIDVLSYLWYIPVSAVLVITVSFLTATVLGYLPCFRIDNPVDFEALRIAATFPNIVALPILIFPSLCEFEVVYTAFGGGTGTPEEMSRECTSQATTMVFTYFFAWSAMFWIFGERRLLSAGTRRQSQQNEVSNNSDDEDSVEISAASERRESGDAAQCVDEGNVQRGTVDGRRIIRSCLVTTFGGVKQTVASGGFIALALGFFTAAIPPLQDALFEPGGPLRFLGSALETLGNAAPPMSTMVVAASLNLGGSGGRAAALTDTTSVETEGGASTGSENDHVCGGADGRSSGGDNGSRQVAEPAIMADPNYGPRRRSSLVRMTAREVSRRSLLVAKAVRGPSFRMYAWFILSRLIVSPSIIFGLLVVLDCTGSSSRFGMPPLAKLVVLLNAALPGALMVVVVLKKNELAESAAIVARVYLPSYLLCIVTITMWTSLGLMISIPRDDGRAAFCTGS